MMKKFKIFMLSSASFFFAGSAFAQTVSVYQGGMPTLETTPTEFGVEGTKIKLKVSNSAPVALGLSYYHLEAVGTDDKRASFRQDPGCISTPQDGNLCECVYTVTQADTNRGVINFGATEDGEEVEEDFFTGDTLVTEYKKTVVETISHNPAQLGWTGSGLQECSMEGWSFTNGTGGFVESDPLMPSTSGTNPFVFNLDDNEVPNGSFWIDPPVAIGYTYEVTGADFVSVTMPSFQTVADPDTYTLSYGSQTISLPPGQSHSFQSPVSSFEITDINPPAPLDANDPTAFPIGVDLTDPVSDVQIKQYPISEGPTVAPSISNSILYPPASANLSANAVDMTGSALQFNWTGSNLSSGNIENPVATFASSVPTPTTHSYAVTATNAAGVSSSTETVGLTLLPKQCVGFQGSDIFDLLPVNTTSLNGNYTLKTKLPNLTANLSGRLNSLKSSNPDFNSISYAFSITDQNNVLLPAVDKASAEYDGSNLNLFAGTSPVQEFWDGNNLTVGQWYTLNIGLNTDPVEATNLTCHTNSVRFRLPQMNPQSIRDRMAMRRPMEVQNSSGSVTTMMVPIQLKQVKAILAGDLGGISVVGGGGVVVEEVITNQIGQPSNPSPITDSGTVAIGGRGNIVVKRPTIFDVPTDTKKTEPDSKEEKKNTPERKVWERRR